MNLLPSFKLLHNNGCKSDNYQGDRVENFIPYIVIFILIVGIPIFVRLFFIRSSKDSNVTDRMLEWQQKKHEDRIKRQHTPWTGE